jgi:ribosomal protein L7/L12
MEILTKLAHTALRTEAYMLDEAGAESKEKTAKKANEKREKFVNMAESRTKNAIKAIRVIAKLGNKNAYQYDDSDVKKIASALNREVEALKTRMSASGGKEGVDFKL